MDSSLIVPNSYLLYGINPQAISDSELGRNSYQDYYCVSTNAKAIFKSATPNDDTRDRVRECLLLI